MSKAAHMYKWNWENPFCSDWKEKSIFDRRKNKRTLSFSRDTCPKDGSYSESEIPSSINCASIERQIERIRCCDVLNVETMNLKEKNQIEMKTSFLESFCFYRRRVSSNLQAFANCIEFLVEQKYNCFECFPVDSRSPKNCRLRLIDDWVQTENRARNWTNRRLIKNKMNFVSFWTCELEKYSYRNQFCMTDRDSAYRFRLLRTTQ